ncbi:MAG: ATP-binding protein [Gammaproteobacteria bacterium]|nr:ATP-binding protein [Gammaproteobacteria bacterium]
MPPARLRRRKYLSTSLLIIDELGFQPMSREEASLFFRLVAYRYGRGSILITTNKSVREWTELLAGDEALTTAILDRLLHKAHVLNIKEELPTQRPRAHPRNRAFLNPLTPTRVRKGACRLNA